MSRADTSASGWTSKRVRSLRLKFGETQETFANRVGVSFTTLSRWENGHTEVSRIAQEKLEALEGATPLKKKRARHRPRASLARRHGAGLVSEDGRGARDDQADR